VLLFHGSEPNRSDERRIGLAIRYIPTRLKQAVACGIGATLVRGKDTTVIPSDCRSATSSPSAGAHKMVSEERCACSIGTGKMAYRA